jgi:hypothetical protein
MHMLGPRDACIVALALTVSLDGCSSTSTACDLVCAFGEACATDACGTPRCRPVVAKAGASCSETVSPDQCKGVALDACGAGLECIIPLPTVSLDIGAQPEGGGPDEAVCQAVVGERGPCHTAVDDTHDGCAQGLACFNDSICLRPCSGGCRSGEQCVDGACTAPSSEGGACPDPDAPVGDNGCVAPLRCDAEAHCVKDECATDADCSPGDECETPECGPHLCVAPPAAGGICAATAEDSCRDFQVACASTFTCSADDGVGHLLCR